MAEVEARATPAFESPVDTRLCATVDRQDRHLILQDMSETTKLAIRADADHPAAQWLAVAFGRSRRDGSALIWGLRPGEWLVSGPAGAVNGVVDGLDTSGHVGVVDLTHGLALFRLTGAGAASVLEKICSLDWSNVMTPDGAVVSASVAKVACDIARHDLADLEAEGEADGGVPGDAGDAVDGRRSYLLACDRSFGNHLFEATLDAGREFGIAVGTAAVFDPTDVAAGPATDAGG